MFPIQTKRYQIVLEKIIQNQSLTAASFAPGLNFSDWQICGIDTYWGWAEQPHIGICKIFFTYSRLQQHDVGSSCFSPSSPPSPPASCCWRTLPSPSCPAPAPPPLLEFSSRCFFVSTSTTTRTSTSTSTSTSSPPSRPFFSSSRPLQSPPEGRT